MFYFKRMNHSTVKRVNLLGNAITSEKKLPKKLLSASDRSFIIASFRRSEADSS